MLKFHRLNILRVKGTVLLSIWWQVILIALYATGLCCLQNNVEAISIDLPVTLVNVIGVLTALLLVFRTNTAYARYYEARKLWSNMTLNIRNLSRYIWVMVEEKEQTSQDLIEKISAVNLLFGFAFATRNYLRDEYSHTEPELRELISHVPKLTTPPSASNPLGEVVNVANQRRMSIPISGKMKGGFETTTLDMGNMKQRKSSACAYETVEIILNKSSRKGLKAFESLQQSNIPIELSYFIASYINSVDKKETATPVTVSMMNTALNNMIECLGGFERILRTPIPLAYTVHLEHVVWLYILALPFQLIGTLNWFTIPVVALASFALLGTLAIGTEIENPFGEDSNDLPLDDFCQVIQKETLRVIGHRPMPPYESWLLSPENHLLAPESRLTASDLMKMNDDDVRRILRNTVIARLARANKADDDGNGA